MKLIVAIHGDGSLLDAWEGERIDGSAIFSFDKGPTYWAAHLHRTLASNVFVLEALGSAPVDPISEGDEIMFSKGLKLMVVLKVVKT